jgi:hypothetical protein
MRILIATLIAASVYGQTFKAYTENSQSAPTNSIATTSTLNIASGDTVVACVGRGRFGETVTLTDGGANTSWTKAGSTSSSGAGETVGDVDLWVLTNATANATATITATFTTSTVVFRWIGVGLYSGLATSSVIDQSSCSVAGCGATTSTNVTAVNVTTTQPNELLVYCGYNNNAANWTAANSFNLRAGTSSKDAQLADKIVSSTGSYPSGNVATLSASVGQVGVFGTLKAAGGSPAIRRRVIAAQ